VSLPVLLSGCNRSGGQGITLAVGGAPNEITVWEQLAESWTIRSGVEVNIMRQPTDTDLRRQGLIIPLKSQQRDPDLFLMDVAWVAQFAASGWLEPLDRYAAPGTIDTTAFFTNILEQVDRREGRLIAMPVYLDCGLLYYRRDLLEKYGYTSAPETWYELVAMAVKVQALERAERPQFYGFVWQGAQYEGLVCNFLEFAGSAGGGLAFENGQVRADTPANLMAARFMHGLIYDSKVSPPNTFTEMREEEVRAVFQQGDALFERNWPYAWSLHQREGSPVKDKVGVALLPHFPGGHSVATLGGWHIGVSVYSNCKEEAAGLLAHIVSDSVQVTFAERLGWNPARRDLYDRRELQEKLPHLDVLRAGFAAAVARPNLPYYTQLSEPIQRYLNGALSGELTPDAALEKIENEMQQVVERYGRE